MRKSSPVFLLTVLLPSLVLLFAVQFWLCSVSVFPESEWFERPENLRMSQIVVAFNLKPLLLGAVPSGLVALAFASALTRMAPRLERVPRLANIVVAAWLAVWVGCMLALHVLLGGSSPASWSPALVTQPATLYGLALVGAGLYAGARRQSI